MILDSSALVSAVRHEDDAPDLLGAIAAADSVSVSAATVLETSIVVKPGAHATLDAILELAAARIVPFDAEQALVAREAYATYGRGSGSPARLNLGDCFSYALAKVTGEPLLYQGDDFTHTDIVSALTPQ